MIRKCFAIVLLLGLGATIGAASPGILRGRCGPQGCNVQPLPDDAPDSFEWRASNLAGRWMLFRGGRYLGTFDSNEQNFRYYLGNDRWGEPIDPPTALPAAAIAGDPGDWRSHGVDSAKLTHEATWSINGRRVTHAQAIGQMLEDDSAKLWLLVIGEGRERVLKDLAADPKYAELLGRARIWSCAANHFSLIDRDTGKPMWPNAGNPSICLAKGDGTVLFEQDGYTGPKVLEDLRKADPSRTPDPKPPDPKPMPAPPAPSPATPAPVPDVKSPEPKPSNDVPIGFVPVICCACVATTYSLLRRGK